MNYFANIGVIHGTAIESMLSNIGIRGNLL